MTRALPLPRSLLFVPATRVDHVAKAFERGADAVVVDLEDAVAPADKVAARRAVAGLPPRDAMWVRCNDIRSAEHAADLAVLGSLPWLAGAVLPKVESGDDVRAVSDATGLAVLALVETAAGVVAAGVVAAERMAAERMAAAGAGRIALGAVDLRLDLGIPQDDDEQGLAHARSVLAVASRTHGLPGPVDGPVLDIVHPDVMRRSVRRARAHGFSAKLCIHPDQVAVVNDGLAPYDDERRWAHAVLRAADGAGGGVFRHEGRMVDAPVVQRARDILATPPLRGLHL